MRIIVKMKFGAHLCDTATSDSDMDYKGIFLPTKEELLLGRVPKSHNYSTGKDDSRNTENDVDTELYSLHYFIKLACAGQTVAMDMLHAPDSMILKKSKIWDDIVKYKQKFYTKNLKSLNFPLRNADFLRKVKQGKLDYLSEVGPLLETLMEEVESLALISNLPEAVDRKFWDQFICETLERELF